MTAMESKEEVVMDSVVGIRGYRQQKISGGIEEPPSEVRIPERKDLGGDPIERIRRRKPTPINNPLSSDRSTLVMLDGELLLVTFQKIGTL